MQSDVITRVRIFISSPKDVLPERDAAVKVVQRLNAVTSIGEKYKLETLSYNYDAPPLAGKHAQETIDETMGEAKDCYLVVVILWSRIGQNFVHPRTHLEYESGTSYEFSTAYASHMALGAPQIFVYRKVALPPFIPDSQENQQQRDRVEAFFRRFEGTPPQYKGMYKSFLTTEEFEDMIFRDIQSVLEHYPPQVTRPLRTNKLETIQSKRVRLTALRQAEDPEAETLLFEIRRELRQTLSPMPFPRYSRFVGRQEKIDTILRQIDDVRSRGVIAIDGIGGVGKTALAYEIARRALDENLVEAVVWESDKPDEFTGSGATLRASDLDVDNLLNSIGRRLGFFDIVSMAQQQKLDFLGHALNGRERFLIVVDNSDTIKGYGEVVSILGRLASVTKVVLTSRHKVEQTNIFTVDLQGLTRDESIEFLREEGASRGDAGRLIMSAHDDVLEAIWAATEGMPLAMKLIVGQTSRTSPTQVLRRLENFRTTGATRPSGEGIFSDFYQYIYKDAWEHLSEAAQTVLVCLSSYDPVEGAGYSSLMQTAQEDMELSLDEVEDAISELIDVSLITPMDDLDERTFVLHPLTRNYVRNLT